MVDPITFQAEMLGAFTKSVHKALSHRTTNINVKYIPSNTKAYRGYVSLFKGNIMEQGFKFDMEDK